MNTGMPASSVAKNTRIKIGIGQAQPSIGVNLFGNVVRPPPAIARIAPHHLNLARQHHETAEPDGAVDDAHRQIEYGHALRMHALYDRDRKVGEQSHEAERD